MKKTTFTQILRVMLVCIPFLGLSTSTKAQDSLQINLKEITVSASFVNERSTPLRIKTISQKDIEKKAIGSTYPELIKDIPGIYSTSESGSYGDAKINIRGFKQENISVLLNGIPISGLTTGNMFWNNWLGLTDATSSIQVQKGIGASMLSDNSVGGTINIITNTTSSRPSFSTGFYHTSYGLAKTSLNYNTGVSKNGWSSSMMVSYAWGNGYVESSDVNSWAYMLNISKKINQKNSLLITVLGSPERHQQRSARLSLAEINQYGLSYSKNWGYLNGEKKNLSENFYHKPYFTIHHFYTPNSKVNLSTSAYLSIGNGGGKWSESKGKRILDYQKEGHIDWLSVINDNTSNPTKAAKNILSDYLAGHYQSGIKSNLNIKLSNTWTLESGLHYQFYSTWEKEKITDLLGAEYWYEDYKNNSLAGDAGRNSIKGVGDFIRTNNGKIINHLTLYSLSNLKLGSWDLRIGSSLMGSTNKRWDKYNYVNDIYSKTASAIGYSIKTGVLNKINKQNSIYMNAAWYSRIPYSDVFFSSGNNQITNDVKNERNLLAEVGYRFIHQRGSFEVTAYSAYWMNKTVMSDPYKALDNTSNRYMIQGLNALHSGIEFSFDYKPSYWLSVSGYASFADWKWKNNVSANIYNDYTGQVIDVINVYSNGLPVGDAPQNQLALYSDLSIAKNITFNIDWRYNSRLYSDFEPKDRKNAADKSSSFKLPDYSLVNIGLTITKSWNGVKGTFFANCNNLLNTKYIERGKDGVSHDLNSFRGFWGNGINGSFGVKFEL